MLKKYITLVILLIIAGCIPYFGPSSKTGFGRQTYKYKCKKAGDCCEVGKNCEEDKQKKETKE